ncbi:MAG: hypothetical protein OIF32_07720, partial [Campylobacterales bacterium]|nr:hypothetical protein [Campylobacterales bacterium]
VSSSDTEVMILPIRIGKDLITEFPKLKIGSGSTSGSIVTHLPAGDYKFKYYVLQDNKLVGRGFYKSGSSALTFEDGETVSVSGVTMSKNISSVPLSKLEKITYTEGWNLVSTPSDITLDPFDIYFMIGGGDDDNGNINAPLSRLVKLNLNGWNYFDYGDNSKPGSKIMEILPSEGFWLKATGSAEVSYPLTTTESKTPKVVSGWNLVGFSKDKTPQDIVTLVESENSGKKVDSVWVYRSGAWKVYYPYGGATNTIEATDKIKASEGIYLKVR